MKKITDSEAIKMFYNLDISAHGWASMYSFLKNGYPPYYNRHMKQYNEICKQIQVIEEINMVNIKLGGIPSFNDFYKSFYDEINSFYDDTKGYNDESMVDNDL